MKCSVYIAATVDGFIASEDGGIDWLLVPEFAVSKLKGLTYDDYIAGVDAIVMGRKSFEKALGFSPWPYEAKPVIVLSGSQLAIPAHLQGKAEHRCGEPQAVVEALAAEGKRHLYIDGGVTIQRFLDAGLIGEMTITRIPLLLGSGIPLFSSHGRQHKLRLIAATTSENGFVQERYEVIPAEQS